MNKVIRIIAIGVFLIALAGCGEFMTPSPAPAAATSTLLPSPATATATPLPRPQPQSESTQTYVAVDQMVPSGMIKDYLTEKIGATAFGGKVFSAYQVMGTEQADQVTKLYLWALVQEYYLDHGTLKYGTGTSEPVVIFIKMQAGKYQIFDFKDAGEGYQYLTVNFPPGILPLIQLPAEQYNQRVALLQNETRREAEAFLGMK